MTEKRSIRISEEHFDFLDKLGANRIIEKMDKRQINYPQCFDLIVKFFKKNNPEYLKLVKMEVEDVR